MLRKTIASTAFVAASMFAVGTAAAAPTVYSVDFSPTAPNTGAAVPGAIGSAANFSAVGFQSDMSSTLNILGTSGNNVSFAETGWINITSFQNAANVAVPSGVNSNYLLGATFSLTGLGDWAGNTFTADPNPTFSINLYANGTATNPASGTLIGKAVLDPTAPQVAFAIAFGSLAPNTIGSALTSLTASLIFTPEPGYSGATGFFQNILPPTLLLSIGNAGGNTTNTQYTVNGDGSVVSFIVPKPGTNLGTANVTFLAEVPEPGVLSLAGLALLGLAFTTRRRSGQEKSAV